jgi:hypothetical protein
MLRVAGAPGLEVVLLWQEGVLRPMRQLQEPYS